tara:strand:- start:16187 stop:16741 length:555 start_codon:yes stop_codon:yes gene_type:complete
MRDFEQYCNENNLLDDMFADIKEKIKKRGKAVSTQRQTEPYRFDLYRGFDADLTTLEKQGDNYVLSPKQSEQGMLWFTHHFVRGYNAVDYVTGRGEWLLTYPLQATKHYDKVVYEDNSVETRSPDEIVSKAEPTENSEFACFGAYCLELPRGWYWTYKTEKFIGTSNKIVVAPGMITQNKGSAE